MPSSTATATSSWPRRLAVVLGFLVGLGLARVCVPLLAQTLKCTCTVMTTVRTGDGSAGAPTLTFDSAPTKGFYKLSATAVGFSGHLVPGADATYDIGITGTNRVRNIYVSGSVVGGSFSPTTILLGNGSSGAPSLAFTSETTLGLYRFAATEVGITGNLLPSTDNSKSLGTTGNRFSTIFAVSGASSNYFYIGYSGTATNNSLLRNQFQASGGANGAGELKVANGDESSVGDIWVNRIASGNSADATFASPPTYFVSDHTYTGGDANVYGIKDTTTLTPSVNVTNTIFGGNIELDPAGTHNYTLSIGLYGSSYPVTSGTTTTNHGMHADGEVGGSGTGTLNVGLAAEAGGFNTSTITNNNVIRVLSTYKGTALTNHYGIYIEDQTLAATTLDYAFYYDAPVGKFAIESTGVVTMVEQTAPGSPAANTARIYTKDNGAGKTEVCALFNTGAEQCFAVQP